MTFSKFLHWFAMSSADPSSISMSLKGILTTAIPIIVIFTGLAHIQLSTDELTADADSIVQLVNAVLVAVGIGISTYGVIRKLILTMTGRNPVAKQLIPDA